MNNENLESELLHMEALINFYFKGDSKKDLFFKKAVTRLNKLYDSFTGMMSQDEFRADCLKTVSNEILEEVNIYYANKKGI